MERNETPSSIGKNIWVGSFMWGTIAIQHDWDLDGFRKYLGPGFT